MRRRLKDANQPTADQRLVLACQVAPDIDGRDFLHRTTPRGKRTEVLVHALNSLGTMEFLAGSADGEKKLERSLRLAEEAMLARRRSLVKPVPDTCFRAHGVRDAQGWRASCETFVLGPKVERRQTDFGTWRGRLGRPARTASRYSGA